MDSSKLRSLLGNGMSNKIWEATLEHAKECVPDDKLYSYCGGGGVILIFNSIYQLIGASIDHIYHHMNELSASQKIIVDKLKELAYRNQNDIAELTLPVHTFTKLPAIDSSINPPVSCWSEPHPDIPAGTVQDEPNTHQLSVLEPSQHHGPRSGLLEDLIQRKDVFGPTQRFGFLNNYNCHEREFFDLPEGKASAIMTTEQPYAGYNNSDFELLTSFMPPLWDHGKALCRTSDGSLGFGHVPQISHTGTSARIGSSRWVKLIAALKWLFIMRQLAARRAVEPANMNRITEIGYPALTTAMCTDATTWW